MRHIRLLAAPLSVALIACGSPTQPQDSAVEDRADIQRTDAVSDSGVETDSGVDTGVDSGSITDSGVDSGIDAINDTGADTGVDSGVDTGADSGNDTGVDVRTDTGVDVRTDSGVDVVTDTGCSRTCGGRCVDVATDPMHCGGCNMPCPTTSNGTAVCVAASCGVRCDAGYFPVGTRCLLAPAPRAIAPLSGQWVTSARPTLRWSVESPTNGARVEICRDAGCAVVVQTFDAPMATSARPATALESGVYFWRLRPMVGASTGAAASPVWTFVVPARPHATLDLVTHQQFDSDNDGQPEILALSGEDVSGSAPRDAFVVAVRAGRLVASATPFRREAGLGRPFGVGDVNGDGFSDAIIAGTGGGCVYHGGASGLVLTTCTATSSAGTAVSYTNAIGAGDINNDGYADVLVSSDRGTPWVRYGSSAGLGAPRDEFNLPRDAGTALCRMAVGDFDANGTREIAVLRWNGTAVAPPTIHPVSGGVPTDTGRRTLSWPTIGLLPWIDVNPVASDVNGDGFQDLLVALRSNDFPRRGGRIVVFLGSATGLPATPSQVINNPDGGDDLFGEEFDKAGDLDGDGFEDVIVSSPYFNSRAGRVYVYRGSASGLVTTPSQSLTGAAANDYFGYAIAGVGPVDRRAQAGIAVATFGASSRRGTVSLFVSGGSPLATTPADVAANPGMSAGFGYQLSSLGH
ncbi:MAG: VCBS repeat-containing protein [Myxococcales bacterium]|nr:VCBS repeat-containing protein [Myxococcales bacterium]